jgi:hypothetical protein
MTIGKIALPQQKARPAKPDAFFFVQTPKLERFRQSSNLNEMLSLAR